MKVKITKVVILLANYCLRADFYQRIKLADLSIVVTEDWLTHNRALKLSGKLADKRTAY